MQSLDSCEYIWEAGVGFAQSPPLNYIHDLNRWVNGLTASANIRTASILFSHPDYLKIMFYFLSTSVFFHLQGRVAEVVAHLLLRGHVPASFYRQQCPQPVGDFLLLHRKQVKAHPYIYNQICTHKPLCASVQTSSNCLFRIARRGKTLNKLLFLHQDPHRGGSRKGHAQV